MCIIYFLGGGEEGVFCHRVESKIVSVSCFQAENENVGRGGFFRGETPPNMYLR